MAKRIASQLVASGHVSHSGRAALKVEVTSLASPSGSTAVNGTPPPDAQALSAVLAGLRPGQVVAVKITRTSGSTATVHVKLGQLPNRS